ncbi:MAG: type II toxin-antitoxin system VapC family toxin [Burkholderiales bacterium]
MILVDTCILIDVAEGDSNWADWSARQLALWSERGPLVISPMVFAEWSSMFSNVEEADSAVMQFGLTWFELPRAALFLAAQAHKLYRRRGGLKSMVLPDFLIGAHAAVARVPLLTRDPRRFESYFADLQIVSPD